MNILIVEDEIFAFKKLKAMIEEYLPNINFVVHAKSIKESVELIENNNNIDLAFFDIQINDGLSFDIFEETKVYFPVIFTTAYNEFALKAFKHNSIDYLLKPIEKPELHAAIDKYNKHWNKDFTDNKGFSDVKDIISRGYKSRFSIKVGEHIKIINTDNISLFYSFNKGTYLKTNKGRDYLSDYSLENLIPILKPDMFFRINRKHIINIIAIKDILVYSNSRLKIKIDFDTEEELIVAREKVKAFKLWLDG